MFLRLFKLFKLFKLYDGETTGDGTSAEVKTDAGNNTALPEGTFRSDDFRSALPEEIRENPNFAKYKSLSDFAQGHLAVTKLVGAKSDSMLSLPDANNFDEVRKVMGKLGAPETVEGYSFTVPEGVPEEVGPKSALATGLAEIAHKMGVLPKQAQGMYEWFAKSVADSYHELDRSVQQTHNTNLGQLQEQWGDAFDQNAQAATFAVSKLGGAALAEVINDAGLGTNPVLMNALSQMGEMLSESGDGPIGRVDGGSKFGAHESPKNLKEKADQMTRDALKMPYGPDRKAMIDKAQGIYQQAARR